MSRIHHLDVAVELQACRDCSFVQARFPFSEEGILRLYADYRSESYNKERGSYEPNYAAVAAQIGGYTEAGLNRVDAITTWVASKINLDGASFLDYGGADGQFLPAISGQKFVYEVSDIPPASGVQRISDPALLESYRYVQLSHVLEHVNEPLEMVRQVAKHVQPGGYLLLEVPQDLDSAALQRVVNGESEHTITVHEHINLYSPPALRALIKAAGLEIVALEAIPVESPVAKQDFVRGLARRPAS